MRLYLGLLMLFLSFLLFSQEKDWKNPNFKTFNVDNQQIIHLDSLQFIPETLQLFKEGKLLNTDEYILENKTLTLLDSSNIKIELYTYPTELTQTIQSKDTLLIVKNPKKPVFYEYTLGLEKRKKSTFGNLESEGSLVRGISFGNQQGAAVQSSLDLKISGKISDNVTLNAYIADYNIPIEQEGYTQQINEFENIYLELKTDHSSLQAGFLDLEQKDAYFGNFFKKITGVKAQTQLEHSNSKTDISVTGSIARGEFNRIQFTGIEGIQGPYQLKGKNNENYIVIVPNSEKIYIDGILLKKGIEDDYTLNYNTGELSFSNKILITQNHRITTEYQYTALNYNRFLVYGEVKNESDKFKIQGTFYQESDAKNSNINDLSNEEKQQLADAGNNSENMYVQSATIAAYDVSKILYQKINTGTEEFFEYSTDSNEVLYQVNFLLVGNNQGNYLKKNTISNGRIFEYIAPIGGIPQGNYEPLTRLFAPEKTQLYTLDSEYKINDGKLELNFGLSNKDNNTFSSIDDENNSGYGIRSKFSKSLIINKLKIFPSLEYVFVEKNFTILDKLNPIEFNRKFNLPNEFSNINQHKLRFNYDQEYKKWMLNYSLDYIHEENNYKGFSHQINTTYLPNNKEIKAQLLVHNSEFNTLKTDLEEHHVYLKQNLKKHSLKLGTDGRNNQNKYEDSALNKSDNWNEFYLENTYSDSLKLNYTSRIYIRKDDTLQTEIERNSLAKGFILNGKYHQEGNRNFELNLHYRNVQLNENQLFKTQENHLLSNATYNQILFKNGFNFTANYTLGNGNEPQREFQYVKVNDGTGIYKWTDYNENEIQEIDEFEVAEFQDLAQYIRVYTETINYLKTAKNGFKFTLNFNPTHIWKTDFSKRITSRFSYNRESSFLKNELFTEFNPFENQNLIYQNKSLITDAYFNRITSHKWSFYYKYSELGQFRNNYLGKESSDKKSHNFNTKNKFLEQFIFENDFIYTEQKNKSENFISRNYTIQQTAYTPSVSYKYLDDFSLKAYYLHKNKNNILSDESLISNELGMNAEYSKQKTTLLAKVSYIENSFTGNSQSLVANTMLEGLKTGNNWVWNLNIQKNLSQFLILNLQYEGRKSEVNKTIHIGNVQLKAVF